MLITYSIEHAYKIVYQVLNIKAYKTVELSCQITYTSKTCVSTSLLIAPIMQRLICVAEATPLPTLNRNLFAYGFCVEYLIVRCTVVSTQMYIYIFFILFFLSDFLFICLIINSKTRRMLFCFFIN